MNKRLLASAFFAFTTLAATSVTNAGTIPTVDGDLGPEWNGITPTVVTYNASAPENNFGAPTGSSDQVSYDIYSRSDSSDVYLLFQATPGSGGSFNSGLFFANLYVSTSIPGGSNLGFEFENNRAFIPGNPSAGIGGYFTGLSSFGIDVETDLSRGGIEVGIPWSFLTGDPMGIGFTPISSSNTGLQLRLSQAFGYSVAGGNGAYPDATRLGVVNFSSVPDNGSTILLLGAAALGLGVIASRVRVVRA